MEQPLTPQQLITQTITLLTPHISGRTADREDLLKSILGPTHPLIYQLDYEGPAAHFAPRCVHKLYGHDHTGSLLIPLLQALKPLQGDHTPLNTLINQLPLRQPSPILHPDIAAHLDTLEAEAEKHRTRYYTDLSGRTQPRIEMDQTFIQTPWHKTEQAKPREFENAVAELQEIRRAVLLGDPGAGKTTTLYKLGVDLIAKVRTDSHAPIPVVIRMGEWRDEREPFEAFMIRSVGGLASHWPQLLAEKRLALLLDGLNEMPTGSADLRNRQITSFIHAHRDLMVITSCRVEDYKQFDLELDKVEVAPLNPLQIKDYVERYLGQEVGAKLFWQIAGEEAQILCERFVVQFKSELPNPFSTFWLENDLSRRWEVHTGRRSVEWQEWVKERQKPDGYLYLVRNPYMLYMLTSVYQGNNFELPPNRGGLFGWFVTYLLGREKLADKNGLTDEGKAVYDALVNFAYALQTVRVTANDEQAALTTMPLHQVSDYLTEQQQYFAASANLIEVRESVRFSHQLLQEYFVARALQQKIFVEGLDPTTIWHPDQWWEPTNWEEAVILLAGLYSNDCSEVVLWLADAQPELTIRCIVESGAKITKETLLRLQHKWVPRLTDLGSDPEAKARAAIGRALGRVRLADGCLLDNREGVGIIIKNGQKLPDIVWGKAVPAKSYFTGAHQNQEVNIAEPFTLSRYPITYAQFQCFVEAPDFDDTRWWEGMPEEQVAYRLGYRLKELSEQRCPYWNHPREGVPWYQAVAFCRWLSDKLGVEVTLPHEHQWEVAARYPDSRKYSYGAEFDAQKGNTLESGIGLTTAVGIYPNGRNEHLNLYDLTGNAWEWCQNKYDDPNEDAVDDSGLARVLRGGSFYNDRDFARAASRVDSHPMHRHNYDVFRVCVCVHRHPSLT